MGTYGLLLGLPERGLVRHNVVLVVEGVQQQEFVPLGAAAHQGTRL